MKGETVQMLRSTSALTKEEMSTAIDRFKKWAAQYEIYLPNPGDNELAKQAEIEIYRYQRVWDIQ